jgi:hypothetical protein
VIVACWLALYIVVPAQAQAHLIAVPHASLVADHDGWALYARFTFTLNDSLEEAVKKGTPLYFTTHFELTRKRWYWFDEKIISAAQTIRLSYQPLTGQYRVWTGGLQLGLNTLEEALTVIKNVSAWHVIDYHTVTPDHLYTAAIQMQLDTALMPKPFQIDAINNQDWSLSSAWKRFNFMPMGKMSSDAPQETN